MASGQQARLQAAGRHPGCGPPAEGTEEVEPTTQPSRGPQAHALPTWTLAGGALGAFGAQASGPGYLAIPVDQVTCPSHLVLLGKGQPGICEPPHSEPE